MSRYHALELLDLTITPVPSGTLLTMLATEDEDYDGTTLSIFCDDKHLKRLITRLRNFRSLIDKHYSDEDLTDEAKLVRPEIRILPPRDYDPNHSAISRSIDCFTLQSLTHGISMGANGTTAFLRFETDYEEISILLARDVASDIGAQMTAAFKTRLSEIKSKAA